MGRQLRGKIGVNLRHHEQPYLFLNSMSGTADLRSDAPAILAGNQLRGWVDITFSGKHSEVFDSDASVQAVVTVEGLERRLNGASGNAIRTAGVSSHPKTADKLEDETTRQQIGRGIVLLWKRHKTYDISHGDDPQIHFEVDIPEDTPDSFEALTLKRYYLSDTKGLHGDVVYFVQVAVYLDKKLAFRTSHAQRFLVMQRPPSPATPIPYHPDIATKSVRHMTKVGNLLIAVRMSNHRLSKGNVGHVAIACRNVSPTPIYSVTARLMEVVIDNGSNVVVESKKIGQIDDVAVPGLQTSVLKDVAQQELHDALSQEVLLPENVLSFQIPTRVIRCSLDGEYTKVAHSLQLTFCMKGIVYQDVKVDVPLIIVSSQNVVDVEDPGTDIESDDEDDDDDASQ
uniref:Arrestin C-terminal-like domain-containing protein n=1 Tax=Craspedostauros australis TaxID=1486917 RepID=A0A7R9ZN26_9STRA|mmetsp:Transcript_21458/g.59689  ORF Transcript_21458/g.59689 Transcript_21458/m.59689 type:complete len:398 (+) Transcript_21458:176-1369(+)|eukprot:CAMPEP_0198110398 /NCGR_PEP_ID=MMETSP1442-20131203/2417_1 /TAXON_ID= /ORGANISM="Craspedostauros australis, Strain CCMP3328" /LENGTH=397 /DNA_ID=CAMNT_0043766441 /DNA_START=167 /DNA_END=1360 /DNA_ORIENTATION=+